jgi:hypothetical protein
VDYSDLKADNSLNSATNKSGCTFQGLNENNGAGILLKQNQSR